MIVNELDIKFEVVKYLFLNSNSMNRISIWESINMSNKYNIVNI